MNRRASHRLVVAPLLLAAACAPAAAGQSAVASHPAPPSSYASLATALPRPALEHEGAAAEGLALRRLGRTQRILMIGAHPDDENTALLAELALGHGADVAYLSLTRGEGGQNLIGGELGEALGLVRSGELLAARRLDGAVQFFTRAYDFGFSKSAEEAFAHWPRDSVLADVVEVVRLWKPDAILSIFSGTPRDGHGHHQAAGILAREAFDAAADPSRFPQQVARGLPAHRADRLYQALWRPQPGEATLTLETGALDPLLGRSRYQVAMASRSRHRSQDMGRAQPAGPQASALLLLESRGAGEWDALSATGVDLVARAIDAGAPEPLVELLRRYHGDALQAREGWSPLAERTSRVALLRRALARLDSALVVVTPNSRLAYHVVAERADAADAVRLAAGVVLDVVADRPVVSPGDTIALELALWNGGESPLSVRSLEPVLPQGWWAVTSDARVESVAPGEVAMRRFTVHVPADAAAEAAYFLERPRDGDLYRWPGGANAALRARPFAPPALLGRAVVMEDVPVTQRAQHLTVDPAYGERRAAALVLPRLSVSLSPEVAVLPLGRDDARVRIQVRIESRAASRLPGELRLTLPDGWTLLDHDDGVERPVAGATLRIDPSPGVSIIPLSLRPPAGVRAGSHPIEVVFVDSAGRRYDREVVLVDHPHLTPRALLLPAAATVRSFEVAVPDVRVGYVPGPGDATAEALAALGVPVDTVPAAALRAGDLGRWDVVVAGIRAFEVNPTLQDPAVRERIHAWVRGGGAWITQYNKYEFASEGYAPLPLTMSRPHGRVTDEAAMVRLLEPSHPILSVPNRIGPDAWQGWVQERGLYFAETWDPGYAPLLEMADPGEAPQRGALLAARLGDGWYVYTGLALFRQLPAGVPGAYRLLANLVALGAD